MDVSVEEGGVLAGRLVYAPTSSVKHLRRPGRTIERSLENPCRQNDVVLGGVVVRVHRRGGHAPPTDRRGRKLLQRDISECLRRSAESGQECCRQPGGSALAGAPPDHPQLTGSCREASSAGPQSLAQRSCSTA